MRYVARHMRGRTTAAVGRHQGNHRAICAMRYGARFQAPPAAPMVSRSSQPRAQYIHFRYVLRLIFVVVECMWAHATAVALTPPLLCTACRAACSYVPHVPRPGELRHHLP